MKSLICMFVFLTAMAQAEVPERSPGPPEPMGSGSECRKQEFKITSLEKKLKKSEEQVEKLTDALISIQTQRSTAQMESGVFSGQNASMGMNNNLGSLNGLMNYSSNSGVNSNYMLMMQQQMLQQQLLRSQYQGGFRNQTTFNPNLMNTSTAYGGSIAGGIANQGLLTAGNPTLGGR